MTGSSGFQTYTLGPLPRPPLKKRGRRKLDLRPVEHVRYGHGKLLAVRQVDGSADSYMADVRFADGTVRTLLLIQRVWVNDIGGLIPETPKPSLASVKAALPVEEIGPSGVDAPDLDIAA